MRKFYLLLIVSLLIASSLLTCADSDSDAMEKLRALPPADPKFEDTEACNDRSLPVLILTARGACLNYSEKRIPFDQVLPALAALPLGAWSHGRILLFFPSAPSIHSSDDDPPPSKEIVKKVMDVLESAGIFLNRNTVSS